MKDRYKILFEGGEGRIEEKKSRFIATSRPVDTEEEALAFIAESKKKYWDASHNCYAYVIGENDEITRAGDDGEPAQTAGRPILEIITGEGIHNVCVVVTRYFGGTLLGTGGLVRAYSGAAKESIKNSTVVEKFLADRLELLTDYPDLGKIQYILGETGLEPAETEFSDKVRLVLYLSVDESEAMIKKITEVTNGRCQIEKAKQVYCGKAGKKLLLF